MSEYSEYSGEGKYVGGKENSIMKSEYRRRWHVLHHLRVERKRLVLFSSGWTLGLSLFHRGAAYLRKWMYLQILMSSPWKLLEGVVMIFPHTGGFPDVCSVDENLEDQGRWWNIAKWFRELNIRFSAWLPHILNISMLPAWLDGSKVLTI